MLKTVLNHHGLDPSDPSQSECDTSDTEEKGYTTNIISGPLATVDHGPVFEFNNKERGIRSNMNILNEIYKIGTTACKRSKSSGCDDSVQHGRNKRCADSQSLTLNNPWMDHGKRRCQREKILEEKKAVPFKCCGGVEHTSLTMDEAVSFSPFAR
jgi:hypothetical protein